MGTYGTNRERPAAEIHQEATANGNAVVNQAGRDQHLYLVDGVHTSRRTESEVVAGESPYPGLAPLGIAQQQWFFGRDRLLAQLVELLNGRLTGGGMQMVIAPSGAGKTSLLDAGLLGRLDRGSLPGSRDWPRLIFTPTAEPLLALGRHLPAPAGAAGAPADLSRRLEALHAAAGHAAAGHAAAGRILVVVDQFEELFTLCPDPAKRQQFIDILAWLSTPAPRGPGAIVILALRADFYAACVDHPPLRAALQDGPLLVGPMSNQELREVILYPARRAGLTVERGLVELLLRDLDGADGDGSEAGRLPLLAHALRASWQERAGATLTVEGYQRTGGIEQAIARTAERAFTGLAPEEERVARSVFLRLVKIGDGTADTRRRMSRTALIEASADPKSAERVVEKFTAARLFTQEADAVELVHEALLRSWPRLRRWIDDNRSGRLALQTLEETAAAWQADGRDSAQLYRGNRLDAAQKAAADPALDDPNPAARELLTASVKARRHARGLRVSAVAALTVLTLAAASAAVVAYQQRGQAVRQRDSATYNRVVAEAVPAHGVDASLGAQLDLVAYRMRPSPATYAKLVEDGETPLSLVLQHDVENIYSVGYHPAGTAMLTTTATGTIQISTITDSPTTVTLPGQAAAFAPNGNVLAAARRDALQIYDVSKPAKPELVGEFPHADSTALVSLTFSPDSRTLATVSTRGSLRLWNVSDPDRPKPRGERLTNQAGSWTKPLSFSADGRLLAAALERTVEVWDVADPDRPRTVGEPLDGGSQSISSVVFSPYGRTLATADTSSAVFLWDLSDATRPELVGRPPLSHSTGTSTLAFDSTGRLLAGAESDRTIMLWNVSDPRQPRPLGGPLTGHTGSVQDVAFNPKLGFLLSAGNDGTVRLWRLPQVFTVDQHGGFFGTVALTAKPALVVGDTDGRVLLQGDGAYVQVGRHQKSVSALVISPDGRTVASGSGDRTVRLWSATDLAPLGPAVTGHTAGVRALAFSPNGKVLASGALDHTIRLWNVADRAHPRPIGPPVRGHTDDVLSVAFSPDGRTLASASFDATVRLWNVADPAHPRQLATAPRPDASITTIAGSVAFSPNGHLLAGAFDAKVALWDVSDPAHPRLAGDPLVGHTDLVLSVAFSPDGRTLASGSADATVRLWDVTDPRSAAGTGQVLTGHSDRIAAVRFSPDGSTLATASRDASVRLWLLDEKRLLERLCSVSGPSLTADAWKKYVGDGLAYRPPCPQS